MTTHPARHALFPGSFDPFTLGHRDLVERALSIFGKVTVAIGAHHEKSCLFTIETRLDLARRSVADLSGVEVQSFGGLLVQACAELGADVVVRGVRGGSDFHYESQMVHLNRTLLPEVDTVLLLPSPEHAHISSTFVRQIASMGGDVSPFVHSDVLAALRARFA